MALFKFKSKGKTRQLVDLIYPVGTIYESTSSTNPGTLFGGTWETFAPGRVLIGAGQGNDGTTSMSFTSESIGGEYKHILNEAELPKHRHDLGDPDNDSGGRGHVWGWAMGSLPNIINANASVSAGLGNGNILRTIQEDWSYTAYTGKGNAHNNLPPYTTIYRWRRVS